MILEVTRKCGRIVTEAYRLKKYRLTRSDYKFGRGNRSKCYNHWQFLSGTIYMVLSGICSCMTKLSSKNYAFSLGITSENSTEGIMSNYVWECLKAS